MSQHTSQRVALVLFTVPLFSSAQPNDATPAPANPAGAAQVQPANEQAPPSDLEPAVLEETVVTATRREEDIANIPLSVTVVDREEVETQRTISNDVGDILGKQVPGFSQSTGSLSNFGQTLRGRNFAVLIDGVPQSTPLRDVARDLRTIHPAAIERVEVIRGATAIYGYGAAGGVVNYITKRPAEGRPQYVTEAGVRFSTEHLGDSYSPYVMQQAAFKSGKFDLLVNGFYQYYNGFFDADGDRIPPDPHGQGGLADSDEYNLFGKVGYDLTDQQRLQVTANRYVHLQDSDYVTVPGVFGVTKATAEEGDNPGDDPGTRNTALSVDYLHEDPFANGTRAHVQVFYQDYFTRFGFSPFLPGGGQSYLESEKFGGRLSFVTPLEGTLPDGTTVTWGADYLRDETAQPLEDGRIWVPPIEQQGLAGFAQLELPLGERLRLRGGVRHERVWLDVDDYTTLFAGTDVEGGQVDFAETLFNLGAVYSITRQVELFGGWSQGFSVADFGRELRGTAAASVEALDPEAQVVDSYELGARGRWERVAGSVAVFYNQSDLGTTFGPAPEFQILRTPEYVYGVEATLDVRVTERLTAGGTGTWMEGRRDTDDNDNYDEYLPGDRVPPPTLTAYVEHQTVRKWAWRNRLQALYSGSRDRFEDDTVFGQGPVTEFVTLDFYSSARVGPGTLRVGVENLLNEDYFPPVSEAFALDDSYSKGEGRTVTLAYELTW